MSTINELIAKSTRLAYTSKSNSSYLSKLEESLSVLKAEIAKEPLFEAKVRKKLCSSHMLILPQETESLQDYLRILIQWLKALKDYTWLLQRKLETLAEVDKINQKLDYFTQQQLELSPRKSSLEKLICAFNNRINFSWDELENPENHLSGGD